MKLCHNVMLGIIMQAMAETTVLAERGGIKRSDWLAFMNQSVVGSTFSRYKSPALVTLDVHPAFTTALLDKDLTLALAVARDLNVPMALAARCAELVRDSLASGIADLDIAALLLDVARGADMALEPEIAAVDDGLSPVLPKNV